MKKLHIYLPIPLVFFISLFLVYWFSSRKLAKINLDFLHLSLADINLYLIILVGLVFYLGGLFTMALNKTSLLPTHPHTAKKIVSTGVFKLTRNPIYLGEVILLFAWTIYLKTFWGILVIIAFVVYTTHFQIKREEEALRAKFGKTYIDYCAKVRRWI